MAPNLRAQSPADGRHFGLWTSCDLHGRAVEAISAALAKNDACESAIIRKWGGDRGARGAVLRPVDKLGKKTPHTSQGRRARRSESGVVKRSVPRTARGESRVTATSGMHEARVLVVEKGVGWQKSVWTHPDSHDRGLSQDERDHN